jgi:hypothetical protein
MLFFGALTFLLRFWVKPKMKSLAGLRRKISAQLLYQSLLDSVKGMNVTLINFNRILLLLNNNHAMNFSNITHAILLAVETWEPQLSQLPQGLITGQRNRQNRSIKQILGHLIDSAANNHQRMVRLQYNKVLVFPDYQQNNDLWIALQNYQNADWHNLIQLWKQYNLHIIQVIQSVDITALDNCWHNFEGKSISLRQMIEGYPEHLTLHMNEIRELINQ